MKVFAHRGASGNHPENTLRAIKAALDGDCDGIEIDIQSCKDDFVVLHDSWLERTTTGLGKVSSYRFSELASVDAGQGEPIPSLQQVFDLVGQHCELNIELKHIENLAGLVKLIQHNIALGTISAEQLIISSFNHPMLQQIKHALPTIRIGALTASIPLDYALFAENLGAFSVNVDKDFVDAAFVTDAKQRGLKVFAYTVDKQEDIALMQTLGVDGIFSNYPCKAKIHLTT